MLTSSVIKILLSKFQLETAERIISHFDGDKADLVICDGAPDGMFYRFTLSHDV